jgi:hypothetical protein
MRNLREPAGHIYFGVATSMVVLCAYVGFAQFKLTEQYADECKVETGVASKKLKLAMKYHGIKTCVYIDENRAVFYRGDKVYDLYDFKQFPKLKTILDKEL